MKKSSIIKTAHHTTKFSNTGKLDTLRAFIMEYNLAVNFYIDYFWNKEISWLDKQNNLKTLDISNNKFDIPQFISTVNNEPLNTPNLSAKMYKSASSQALGIISSIISKRNKLAFKLNIAIHKGNIAASLKLQEQLDNFILTKPTTNITTANLDSNTVEFVETNANGDKFKEFDGFLRIVSMSKTFGYIEIPVKFHRHIHKLISNGYIQKSSWFVSVDKIYSIWEKQKPTKKTSGKKIGADQGITTCLTLSDGQITGKCSHGHDLTSIMHKIAKCTKGSKGIQRAYAHRTNYINWAIKQLDFSDINELGYEDVKNLRKGKDTSNFMKGWTFTAIRTAIYSICQELGVQVIEQNSIYRSQRCSSCGYVHKKNRTKKIFKCMKCDNHMDADLNGAINHENDLYPLSYEFMSMKMNISGFYWLESGIYDLYGEEITVPLQINYIHSCQ